MRLAFLTLSLTLIMSLFAGEALCGANAGARAWLSWDPRGPSCDLPVMPSGQVYLYVQLGDIVGLGGCEFLLMGGTVSPPWGDICHEFVSGEHPSGVGEDCTWMMRGTQVVGVDDMDVNYWFVAFATENECSPCGTGNVARLLVDFDACEGDLPTGFCLEHVRVTDCTATIDILPVTCDAMVLDPGGHWNCPCSFEDSKR